MAETSTKASLGCGTFVLIALVVMFFGNSNGGNKRLERSINELKNQVSRLSSGIEQQSDRIEELETEVTNLRDQSKAQTTLLKELKSQRAPRPRVIPPVEPE